MLISIEHRELLPNKKIRGSNIMSKYQKMFKIALATALSTSVLVAALPNATQAEEVIVPTFSDVKNTPTNHLYAPVMDLASRQIITGYEDGTFKPYQSINRKQAAKIMALALDLDLDPKKVKDPGFTDINKDHPYYVHIAALVEAGIIKGYNDNTFGPNNTLTRAQMAKMITLGFDFDQVTLAENPFTDISKDKEVAGFVQTLYANEITTGTTATTFSPYSNVTRGQMASFIFRSEKEVGNIVAEDLGQLTKTTFTAGADLTEGQNASDVASLTVEWFDQAGAELGKGTLNKKFAADFPTATQISMPFDANFNYVTDGYWTVAGNFIGEPTKVKFTVTFKNGDVETAENTRELSGNIVAQDFGLVSGDKYSAGAVLTEYKTVSDIDTLKVKWFDLAGNVIGEGTMTEKFAKDYPTATDISMPFDANFAYIGDGYWTATGNFKGEPAKVEFSVKYKNGKEATVENTRTVSGDIKAQDFSNTSETSYSAGAALTENKTVSDIETLTAEWFDKDGKALAKGTMTEKFATDYPTATQISMPFDPAFDYVTDGFWKTEGDFTGEPTKVTFSVKYKNGKEATVDNNLVK